MAVRQRWTGAVLAAALGFGATACGPTPPSGSTDGTASPSPAASVTPGASPSESGAIASPSDPLPSRTSEIPPSLPPGVTVDPGLLEVLPVEVDGVALEPDQETAVEVAADPLLAESALSLAVALAAAPGSDDFAVASVIRLRPDVFDVAFYQEWRDTYNEAACEVSGGFESETTSTIAGHETYLGTCAGGAGTYHTYLEDQGFIVSVTATGPRRLGAQVIAGIAE